MIDILRTLGLNVCIAHNYRTVTAWWVLPSALGLVGVTSPLYEIIEAISPRAHEGSTCHEG